MHTFSHWIATPQNRSARLAAQRVAECVASRRTRRAVNPLFLHGPAGAGKSHLVHALAAEMVRLAPDRTVRLEVAGDLFRDDEIDPAVWTCDLLILEDVQHLPLGRAETLVQRFDERLARRQQMVFTATCGPRQLAAPARLTSRLAGGLVVGLEPFAPEGRLAFLLDHVQRRQLPIGRDVLVFLSEHVGGSGRQLEGAVTRLETLARLQPGPLDLATVQQHFQTEADAARPSVETIAQRVSRYYQVPPRELQSRRRHRHALVPRQVSMYLARQLTRLSLEQIGAYFGGRDHSTVLHACRKVEQALESDAVLSGAVRQLHADLV